MSTEHSLWTVKCWSARKHAGAVCSSPVLLLAAFRPFDRGRTEKTSVGEMWTPSRLFCSVLFLCTLVLFFLLPTKPSPPSLRPPNHLPCSLSSISALNLSPSFLPVLQRWALMPTHFLPPWEISPNCYSFISVGESFFSRCFFSKHTPVLHPTGFYCASMLRALFLDLFLVDSNHSRPGPTHDSGSSGGAVIQSFQFNPCQTH